ncbi:EcoAI/FtnUII family type I restriction enzme subunit R [Oceanicaulis sp.]|uniref:EcoAI/FtnUII family type I restriction enzme subunit R n=1 Tax=Oceanicaulis sp. TaxID=1924941 RepID=UPI003D273F3E
MAIHLETEADTRAERISPALKAAGWGVVIGSKVRREVICPGRIQIGGKRANPLTCDYVLFYKGQKLATLEAKKASVSHREGVGQAKEYAQRLETRFAYASNGLEWREIDMVSGSERDFTSSFPTPQELWDRTFGTANEWRDRFGEVRFETDGGKWEPRYYQHNAINAALEAVAKGQERILLTLATGTGKTSIAFQIAWKLFGAKWNITGEPTRRPRILFLADRNILADQAFNSFSAFQSDAIARIEPDSIRKRGGVPRNASVFFTIFQTFMAGNGEPNFQGYEPDFFDFIIIDECHRGGAKDESEWRRILEYFEPATQLGLTATPKRKHNADTYSYFGEPVYTYALKDGIEDGFLTPFKVRQMASTIDEYVFTGDDEVLQGDVEIGDVFTEGDFNTRVVIAEREMARIREFMDQINPRQKSIVFCATQDHAALVRDLINEIKPFPDVNYCCRVTADDGKLGEQHLRDFQDNEKTIPTILTTSQKLSTGVDARNVRNIVLMRPVKSMIEFKQIVGRGTRVYDGKDFFTIYDFVKAYEHFQDPEWDGEPLEPVAPTPRPESPPAPLGDADDTGEEEGDDKEPTEKVVIKLPDGKVRKIQFIASTSYWFQGRPVSAQEFMEMLFGDLASLVESEDELREKWSNPETRAHFMTVLEEKGYDRDKLHDMKRLVDAADSDIFDVLAYVRFSLEPKTRHERADAARNVGLEEHAGAMRDFLDAVLSAYEREGSQELGIERLSPFLQIKFGTLGEAKAALGGDLKLIRDAFIGVQRHIYSR